MAEKPEKTEPPTIRERIAERAPLVHIPPSQQVCPGPVPKPGEPVFPTKGHLAVPQTDEKK